jgi:transposase
MFFPEARVRVYLYGKAVDMRKSFDGLYGIAHAAFAGDPTAGDLYVFVSRSGALIKVLYFDRSGWCIWAKRLESGRFISDWARARTHEIDCTQLKLLLESIRAGHNITMDETPIKAGQAGAGKMKTSYFWPIYGELDEVCFAHFESRRHEHVEQALGLNLAPDTVLLSDGYEAYAAYAAKMGLTHAQCWTHSRRTFFEAQGAEPQAATEALRQIGALYEIEEAIREAKLSGEAKRKHRQEHSKPRVDKFFEWVDEQFERQGLLPSNPLTKALAYVRERRAELKVFLEDPEVPLDTNRIENTLRVIALGRRNWLFCWTEVGAKYVGIVQSLLATCRLHDIDPNTYLVDVLQRVGQHPAARVAELTPRQWKTRFADNPLRSDLHRTAS